MVIKDGPARKCRGYKVDCDRMNFHGKLYCEYCYLEWCEREHLGFGRVLSSWQDHVEQAHIMNLGKPYERFKKSVDGECCWNAALLEAEKEFDNVIEQTPLEWIIKAHRQEIRNCFTEEWIISMKRLRGDKE